MRALNSRLKPPPVGSADRTALTETTTSPRAAKQGCKSLSFRRTLRPSNDNAGIGLPALYLRWFVVENVVDLLGRALPLDRLMPARSSTLPRSGRQAEA